jgi:hypothetical protein
MIQLSEHTNAYDGATMSSTPAVSAFEGIIASAGTAVMRGPLRDLGEG